MRVCTRRRLYKQWLNILLLVRGEHTQTSDGVKKKETKNRISNETKQLCRRIGEKTFYTPKKRRFSCVWDWIFVWNTDKFRWCDKKTARNVILLHWFIWKKRRSKESAYGVFYAVCMDDEIVYSTNKTNDWTNDCVFGQRFLYVDCSSSHSAHRQPTQMQYKLLMIMCQRYLSAKRSAILITVWWCWSVEHFDYFINNIFERGYLLRNHRKYNMDWGEKPKFAQIAESSNTKKHRSCRVSIV